MRILFLEDDGLTALLPRVRAGGDVPVVLRTGAYDEWHHRETFGPGTEVLELPRGSDAATIAEAAAGLRPDALVSLALLDPHVERDAEVAARLRAMRDVPVVANSPAAARLANDKSATKRLLARHGLPVTEAVEVSSCGQALEAAARLGYPVVFKRNDGYSGMGMRLFADAAQVGEYYRRSPGPMIAEAFVAGLELSVDVLAWQGRCRALSIVSKGETDRDLRRHPIYRLRIAPHPLEPALAARVRALAEEAVRLLGLVGVAECEMILHPEKGPFVLEVNPRIAGTLRLSALASGVDPHRCLLDMARGRFDPDAPRPRQAIAAQVPLASLDGAGREALLSDGAVHHVKDIDWMPGLGVRASVTVRAETPAGLHAWLRDRPGDHGFADAARRVGRIFNLNEPGEAAA